MSDLDFILGMASQQGSKAWADQRLGRFTASRFADLMTNNRKGDAPGETALKYIMEIAIERLTGQPLDTFKGNAATEWGNEWEAKARKKAEEKIGPIALSNFVVKSKYVGGSPDGLTDDAIVEIKCPYNSIYHLQRLEAGECPKEYYPQVQGNIWINDKQRAWYIDYDPRFPATSELLIVEVPRDDEFISKLETRIAEATEVLEQIVNKYR